jgi:hypothetical protein
MWWHAELSLSFNKLSYLPKMLLTDFTHWRAIKVIDIQVWSLQAKS